MADAWEFLTCNIIKLELQVKTHLRTYSLSQSLVDKQAGGMSRICQCDGIPYRRFTYRDIPLIPVSVQRYLAVIKTVAIFATSALLMRYHGESSCAAAVYKLVCVSLLDHKHEK